MTSDKENINIEHLLQNSDCSNAIRKMFKLIKEQKEMLSATLLSGVLSESEYKRIAGRYSGIVYVEEEMLDELRKTFIEFTEED